MIYKIQDLCELCLREKHKYYISVDSKLDVLVAFAKLWYIHGLGSMDRFFVYKCNFAVKPCFASHETEENTLYFARL